MPQSLQEAIKAIKAGDKVLGKQLLAQIVREDPLNEAAWLWLSDVVETDEERIKCLKSALRINPDNQLAQRGLARLEPEQSPDIPLPPANEATDDQVKTSQEPQPRTPLVEAKPPIRQAQTWYQNPVIVIAGSIGSLFFVIGLVTTLNFFMNISNIDSTNRAKPTATLVIKLQSIDELLVQQSSDDDAPEATATPLPTPVVLSTFTPTPHTDSADDPTLTTATDLRQPWVATGLVNNIAYFLFNSPNRIERYDLAMERWLESATLNDRPTAFTVDADGIFIAFGPHLFHYTADSQERTPLFTIDGQIKKLFTLEQYIYIYDHNGVLYSANKFSGQIIDRENIYYNLDNLIVTPLTNKAFAIYNSNRFVELTLNSEGMIDDGLSRYSGSQYPYGYGQKLFAFPDGIRFINNRGTVYNSTDLERRVNVGQTVQDIAFYGESPIIYRDGLLIGYTNTLQEDLRHLVDTRPLKIYIHGEFVHTFSVNPVEGIKVEKIPVGYLFTPQ